MEAHAGKCHEKRLISFTFEKISRISLSFRVAPFLYREYEYGLLAKPEFFRESKILGSLCSVVLCNQLFLLECIIVDRRFLTRPHIWNSARNRDP